jgi:uncharacterized protein YndB with AHSA1/START domain
MNASDTIVEEITINGTAERIFEALTDPAQRIKWWGGERRFQVTEMESDLRPGGKWMMRGIGYGKPASVLGEYRHIAGPHLFGGKKNCPARPSPDVPAVISEHRNRKTEERSQ